MTSKANQPGLGVSRRSMLQAFGLLSTALAGLQPVQGDIRGRILIVGGGFGGSTMARQLRALGPDLQITLIDRQSSYTACPFSNLVISGHRELSAQQFTWQKLTDAGIQIVNQPVTDVDTSGQRLRLADGTRLNYDKLIMAPGIRLRWNAIEGYDEAASAVMPHAWHAGSQTLLLRRQLQAMPDGGVVAISVPDNPYRCPPGPYERASLVAHYLAQHKPRSKLLLLDAKDNFSKKPLFQAGWRELYGDLVEWRGLSDSGKVNRVDARSRTAYTDFEEISADVTNIIPPQAAAQIATDAGLTDASGWCPVEPLTFRSALARNVHVIGDAAIANAMPKSAFAANAQAKLCAAQIARELAGEKPVSTTLINTCYSLLAPDYGISVAGVYQPGTDAFNALPNTGGTSAIDASARTRKLEANYARSWFDSITRETFG